RSPIDRKLHDYTFASRDHVYAWQIAATAQRWAAYNGYDPASLGIEAYVLAGYPDRNEPARFDPDYFWLFPAETPRRLTLLSVKRHVDEKPLDAGLVEQLQRHHEASYKPLPDNMVRNGWSFMGEMLEAYRNRGDATDDPVHAVLSQTRHPFTYSAGFSSGIPSSKTPNAGERTPFHD
ncbi:MAG: hypothetical protein MI741_06760, partial [Rhodospirillales bacterium]|nr:hypothetical protein [Rhodospirillales bacterium]